MGAQDFDTYYTCRLDVDEGSDKKKRTLLPLVAIMHGSRNFGQGGGGSGPTARKQPGQRFYFSSQLILQFTEGSNGFIAEKTLLFQGSRGDPTFYSGGGGGPTFSRGEMHINCDFPGGSRPPTPPPSLWIRTWPC